ncbi:hypothetical protein Xets_02099 [Xenorhabdus sp. TS4]|nr:hypothetical protein [Xenorhabdus sp. TS4]
MLYKKPLTVPTTVGGFAVLARSIYLVIVTFCKDNPLQSAKRFEYSTIYTRNTRKYVLLILIITVRLIN